MTSLRKPFTLGPVVESPKTAPLNSDATISTQPKKQIVPEFIKIDKMSIRYIQPFPAPDFITFFQSLKHEDVDFVRIPIDKKSDALYLRKSISKLLQTLTGMHWDKIEALITKYNSDPSNVTERNVLLCIMDLATYFSDKDNIEFLK
jgi:hypothetical protein